MMRSGIARRLTAAMGALFLSGGVAAQALSPAALDEATVARRGGVELTVGEVDVKIRSIPEDLRAGYMTEADRAARLIDTMLLTKQLAARAKEQGIESDPEFQADLALVTIELLSRHAIEKHVAGTPLPNVEALAYERYLADPAQITPPPRVDVSHILVPTDGKDEAAARALADAALARAKAGEDFLALAEEYGEGKGGIPTLRNVDFSRMDAHFTRAVEPLREVGTIVGPVRTQFGYHVIRLDMFHVYPTPPFDEVKAKMVATLTAQAKDRAKADLLSSLSQLDVQLNDPVVQHLRTRYLPPGEAEKLDALQAAPQAGE